MWYPYLIGAAALIIVVLVVIAVRLQLKVRAQEAERREKLQALEQAAAEQRERINKSIQVIALATLQEEQLTLTEASLRIRGLLDGLAVDETVQKEFVAFYELAKATEHIPILEEWKALSLKKRLAFDKERTDLEEKYREFVLDAARRIQGRHF